MDIKSIMNTVPVIHSAELVRKTAKQKKKESLTKKGTRALVSLPLIQAESSMIGML